MTATSSLNSSSNSRSDMFGDIYKPVFDERRMLYASISPINELVP